MSCSDRESWICLRNLCIPAVFGLACFHPILISFVSRIYGAPIRMYMAQTGNPCGKKIITRDANICRGCGNRFESSQLHVHHLVPFRNFEDPAIANQASNLVSLCPACHRKAELSVMIRSGLAASAYALRSMAPLLIMCDREDISLITENRSILNDGNPAVLVYDNIPGGLGGLSRKLFDLRKQWIKHAIEIIQDCGCESGCPACVGPVGEPGYGGKKRGGWLCYRDCSMADWSKLSEELKKLGVRFGVEQISPPQKKESQPIESLVQGHEIQTVYGNVFSANRTYARIISMAIFQFIPFLRKTSSVSGLALPTWLITIFPPLFFLTRKQPVSRVEPARSPS